MDTTTVPADQIQVIRQRLIDLSSSLEQKAAEFELPPRPKRSPVVGKSWSKIGTPCSWPVRPSVARPRSSTP